MLETRTIWLGVRRTSVALEPSFWAVLERAAARDGVSVPRLVREIRKAAGDAKNLASRLRLYALDYAANEISPEDRDAIARGIANGVPPSPAVLRAMRERHANQRKDNRA